jgi:hypothetical protein
MVALIDNTVSVTTRQSDNVPTASDVAMALVNREEATGAGRLAKPTMPGDRIMVLNPSRRGRITPRISLSGPATLRRISTENGGITAKVNFMPAVVNV